MWTVSNCHICFSAFSTSALLLSSVFLSSIFSLPCPDPGNSLSRGSSSSSSSAVDSSTERLLQKKQHTNNSLLCNPDFASYGSAPRSPSTLPRSYTASSRRDELDSLIMQHSEVERKKEVFLDHLRQKYPHHAAIIMGQQERIREQVRSQAVVVPYTSSTNNIVRPEICHQPLVSLKLLWSPEL